MRLTPAYRKDTDFDGDGKIDFVTGGMYTDPPHDRRSRVLLWMNEWPGPVNGE